MRPVSDLAEAQLLVERGEALLVERRVLHAIELLQLAEESGAEPDRCAGARWHCWMLLGDMERAWWESDAIRARGGFDALRFWDGSDPTGKRVMVRSLHGYGDAVQNLRFLPELRRRAKRVTLEVAPELVRLARHARGADEVITWGEDAPAIAPEYDMQIEITELPYLLRCKTHELPAEMPYLRLPDALVQAARDEVADGARPNVGLAWSSSRWDPSRSIPLESFRQILSPGSLAFWSLQTAADNEPWRRLCTDCRWPVRVAGEGSAEQTAAYLRAMDLVITVDTFVAHLAGALGRPVWLLLKHDADWRWGLDGDNTPWYPTMRLFRQRERGNWQPVLAELRQALERWSAERTGNGAGLGHVRRVSV